jgi:hypothetical protein
MSEFITQVLVSLAMADWEEIRNLTSDQKGMPNYLSKRSNEGYSPINSGGSGSLHEPAKEPLLIS